MKRKTKMKKIQKSQNLFLFFSFFLLPPPDQSTAMDPPTQSVSPSRPSAESAEGK